MLPASPRTTTVSRTRFPGALATVTVAGDEGTVSELALVKAMREVS